MTGKVWYTSKQAWINIIGGTLALLADPLVSGILFGTSPGSALIPTRWLPYIMLVTAALNFILRSLKNQSNGGLTLTAQPADVDAVSGATLKKIGALFLAVAVASQFACPANFKVDTVASYQGMEILFDGVDDGARILCFDTTHLDGLPHPWHCTAGVPGMTDLVYQRLADKIVAAYDAQIRLGPVLKGMKVADTMDVADLLTLSKLSGEVQDIANAITPSSAVSAWSGQVTKWVNAVAAAKAIIVGGGK